MPMLYVLCEFSRDIIHKDIITARNSYLYSSFFKALSIEKNLKIKKFVLPFFPFFLQKFSFLVSNFPIFSYHKMCKMCKIHP